MEPINTSKHTGGGGCFVILRWEFKVECVFDDDRFFTSVKNVEPKDG